MSFVSCTAQTATPSEWSMVTSSLLELRMPLQLNWTNWAVEGDRGASAGPAAGRAGWLHAAGGGSNNGLGAGGPGRRMTVGEGLKLSWGREGVEGLKGAAEMKANGEKVRLAGDMDGGEGKMGREGLKVKGERLKLCCVRVGGRWPKRGGGAGAQGGKRKVRRRHKGGGRRQKGNRRTVGQWGKSETGWGQSWQGRAHQGGRSVASAFNVAGPELIMFRVRVNPSEQQQEGHGRGRKEREERGGSKRAAKGASSGLPGRAPIRKLGGGGGKGWSWREPKNAALDPEILGHPPRRRTTIPGVQPPRRGAAIAAPLRPTLLAIGANAPPKASLWSGKIK